MISATSATSEDSVPRVRRDAWTRLLYLQLGAFAFFLYAFSPALGFLRDDLHLSAAVAGLHSTTYAVGVTIGGVAAPWYLAHAGGSRRAMWLGLAGLCASVALFCAVPILAVTLPAAAICGVFGSWVCIAVPAALARSHGADAGPAAITEANAVGALVGLAAPLAVGGAAALGIGWRTALLAIVPLTAVLYAVLGRVGEPELPVADLDQVVFEAAAATEAAMEAAPPASPIADPGWRSLSRLFWINQIAGISVAAIEFSLTLWCATLLRDRAHLSPSAAATGVTALVLGMAVGRLAGGRLALRVSLDRLLFASFATNAVGFAMFWFADTPAPMFAGLTVAGLGVSLQYPLVSSRGIRLAEGRAELAGAVNMFGGGIAIGLAPFALGFLADRIGIHSAYLLVPLFIVVAVTALAASRPERQRGSVGALASETIGA
jgi:predicted MFS family arabinose efflux permease